MKKKILTTLLAVLITCGLCFSFSACFDSSNNSGNNSNSSFTESSGATIGERNALRAAKNYLQSMGFSRKGLIEQLEFEGYTHNEAIYAVDNCGANWNAQAVRVAKNYLNIMPFSRKELLEQLEFEGFTNEEANYGVEQAYK